MRFLTRTSVLERMCGGLCDAVLERSDSASMLESLERSNRFMVPLDRTRTWYRYHHLFRDLLRSELAHREPQIADELNRRAMEWGRANGLPETALHYGHEAGETDAVTRLIEQLMFPTYFGGGIATIERWLDWYDEELRGHYPTIAVLGAWMNILTGRAAEGARWERAAQRSSATPELPDGSASIEAWTATLRAYTCPGGIEQMLADCGLALEQLGPEGWWRPVAQIGLGAAHVLLGDPERARPALEPSAAEISAAAGAPDEGSVAFAELALLDMDAGAWEVAEANVGRGVALIEEVQLEDYLACGLAMATAARVAVHRGDGLRASTSPRSIACARSSTLGSRGSRSRPAWSSRASISPSARPASREQCSARPRPSSVPAHGWARLSRSRPSCANALPPRRARAANGP